MTGKIIWPKEEDNCDRVMLEANRFDKSSEASESLVGKWWWPFSCHTRRWRGKNPWMCPWLHWLRWFDCLSSEGTWHWMRVIAVIEWQEEGWSSTLLRKDLHPPRQSAQAQHCQISPQLSSSQTPQMVEDNRTHCMQLWLPRMGCYVVDYVKGCDLCKCTKTFPASPTGKLMPNWSLIIAGRFISVDLIMELPWGPRLGHYYSGSWSSIQMSLTSYWPHLTSWPLE